jgi:hypothetical protein
MNTVLWKEPKNLVPLVNKRHVLFIPLKKQISEAMRNNSC